MSAETVDGGRLREAAKRKSDDSILLQIDDLDCVMKNNILVKMMLNNIYR